MSVTLILIAPLAVDILWIFANLTAGSFGTSDFSKQLINHGILPTLIRLLEYDVEEVSNNTMTLGRLGINEGLSDWHHRGDYVHAYRVNN